jgi:hypothetical protein
VSGNPRLIYSESDLLAEDAYATQHVEAGVRLHGGFDADGRYVSPRMLHRAPAIRAWTTRLSESGGELMQADSSLLAGVRYPSPPQLKLLLTEGLGQTLWNSLTITGHIEARGRILADMTFPDFQNVIDGDISQMGLGHLHTGLLKAHGLDEGGEPDRGIGGHDQMWFALRDIAFGEADYPEPSVPDNIARPEEDMEKDPPIDAGYARLVYFLLNLLLIEFRAERIFTSSEALLRDPELFVERREQAEHAAEIVGRIRQDEVIHIDSLRLYLGEVRNLRFFATNGGTVPGSEVVDDMWRAISHWATDEQPRIAAEQQRTMMQERIALHPEAARVQTAFDALEERSYDGS